MEGALRGRGACIMEVVVAIALIGVIAVILFPVFAQGRCGHPRAACASSLRQISTALFIYETENDGRLPMRDQWQDALYPYTKNDYTCRCPDLSGYRPLVYGYAVNSWMQRHKTETLAEPAKVPLVYDSLNLARNASDPFLSFPDGTGEADKLRRNVAYDDGHARFVEPGAPLWRAP